MGASQLTKMYFYAMDEICLVLFIKFLYLVLFPVYHMDVRDVVYVKILNTCIIIYCTLTSYQTMMTNDGHYTLNEYGTSTCWEKTVIL